jgi:hypothetical protein
VPNGQVAYATNERMANALSGRLQRSPLSGEVLTSRPVRLSTCVDNGRAYGCSFKMRGMATGRYPGTFSASGAWDGPLGGPGIRSFGETFTIRSGGSTLSGSIEGSWSGRHPPMRLGLFGPAGTKGDVRYTSGSWSGTATTTQISSYKQTIIQDLR